MQVHEDNKDDNDDDNNDDYLDPIRLFIRSISAAEVVRSKN